MTEGSDGGRRRGGVFDDLAGVAGGAFSVLAGARAEAESAMRGQLDALVQRLELVRREELDAALAVARDALAQVEALSARVTAIEGAAATTVTPGPAPIGGTVPVGDPAAAASAGLPGVEAVTGAAPGATVGGTVPVRDPAAAASGGLPGQRKQPGPSTMSGYAAGGGEA